MLDIEDEMNAERLVSRRDVLAIVAEGGILIHLRHFQSNGIGPTSVAILPIEAHGILVVLGDFKTVLVSRSAVVGT